VPSLLRAAQRIFGHWSSAIEAAGFDYDNIRRYRQWTRERVIARIREWHAKGFDVNWRYVATVLDPALAAAALHAGRFTSWNDALRAAGLDPERVSRYRRWTISTVRRELQALAQQDMPLDQDTLQREAPALLAAIYRLGEGLTVEREELQRQLAPMPPLFQPMADDNTVYAQTVAGWFEDIALDDENVALAK